MSSKNDFDLVGIGSVFDQPLQVPKYQREYSWGKQEVNQLLEDIGEAKSAGNRYFLGTIVTVKNTETGRIDVIDGQQRLTTVSLIYRALISKLQALNASARLIRKIEEERLSAFHKDTEDEEPKLILNIDDDEFYRRLMNFSDGEAQPVKPSHKKLKDALKNATKWVSDSVKGKPESTAIAELKSLDTYLEQRAEVLLLKTNDASQAFKMFETLNDRGLRTSQADLVKSYLFGQSTTRIDDAQSRWSSMKDNLTEISDNDTVVTFLRHAIISTRAYVRAQDVFDYSRNNMKSQTSALAFLNDLENLSKSYVSTFKPESAAWTLKEAESREALKVLNLFDVQPIRPLILSLYLKFTEKELTKALKLLVAIIVRNVIAMRSRSASFEENFADAALEVYKGNLKTAENLKTKLSRFIVSDSDFKKFFESATVSNASLARYYLRALEQQQNAEANTWYIIKDDATQITLEHILPKSFPKSGWKSFDTDLHRAYRNRIGNLCLLDGPSNHSDGSDPFASKKKSYGKSLLSTTNSLSGIADWTTATINRRQENLSTLAIEVWKT